MGGYSCAPEPERDKGHHTKGLVKADLSSTGTTTKDMYLAKGRPTQADSGIGPAQLEPKCCQDGGKASEAWTRATRLWRLPSSGWDPCQDIRRGEDFGSSIEGARSCRAAASTASPVVRETSQAPAKSEAGSGSPASGDAFTHRAPRHPALRRPGPVKRTLGRTERRNLRASSTF